VLRLGLTGGIGAGKSTVARRLVERGAVLVDADRLAREVVEPGTPGLAEVGAAFGPGVLAADGTLDRPALGRLVFGDEASRRRLNAILHPRIAALTAERTAAGGPDAVVVHDVPLLVENGMGAGYHLVLVVLAPEGERIRRLVADRGMSPEDAAARIAAQADDAARRAAADVLLDNAGAPDRLRDQVDRVWDERVAPYAENLRRRRPAVAPSPGPGPDGAALARLRARLERATGGAARPDGAGSDLVLVVPGPGGADALRGPLEEAGFVRVEGGGPGERVHTGADPGAPVTVRVRPEG